MNHPLLQKASIVFSPTAYETGFLNNIKPVGGVGNELAPAADFTADFVANPSSGTVVNSPNGTLTFTNSTSTGANVQLKNRSVTTTKTYKIQFTISNYVSGTFKMSVGNQISNVVSANGTYTFYIEYTSGLNRNYFYTVNSTLTVSNISVKEVLGFQFTRNTTATRVNESGLIETVAVNVPRIDYLSGVGAYLLEPQASNTATYSNDFTQGDIFDGSGNPNANNTVITATSTTSPDGTNNAWKLTDNNDGGTGVAQLAYYSTNVTSGRSNTFSVFLKKGSTDFGILNTGGYDGTANGSSFFNLSTGTLGNTSANHSDVKMEDYGNGWYRCSISMRTTTDVIGSFLVGITTTNGTGQITRDGSNFLYMFGVQAVANNDTNIDSLLVSYIPTSGATVSKLLDSALNAGNTDLINSPEGVFYLHLAGLYHKHGTSKRITLSNGSGDNAIKLEFATAEDKITLRVTVGGSSVASKTITGTYNVSQFHKYAIQWKENDFKFYIDGVEIYTDTNGATYSADTLDRLNIAAANGGRNMSANIKCIAVFKEILTDAELVTLTS